jgi:hypothetical protein
VINRPPSHDCRVQPAVANRLPCRTRRGYHHASFAQRCIAQRGMHRPKVPTRAERYVEATEFADLRVSNELLPVMSGGISISAALASGPRSVVKHPAVRKTSSTIVMASASSPQYKVLASACGATIRARTTRRVSSLRASSFRAVFAARQRALHGTTTIVWDEMQPAPRAGRLSAPGSPQRLACHIRPHRCMGCPLRRPPDAYRNLHLIRMRASRAFQSRLAKKASTYLPLSAGL